MAGDGLADEHVVAAERFRLGTPTLGSRDGVDHGVVAAVLDPPPFAPIGWNKSAVRCPDKRTGGTPCRRIIVSRLTTAWLVDRS